MARLIKVLVITHNRPQYTRLSLDRLCDTAPENMLITIWDNASSYETRKIIGNFERHPRVERVIYNQSNEKLRLPTNWFWERSKDAFLLGKVDDDCLVPPDWGRVLEQAHIDIKAAGVLGCWHFFPEDFSQRDASKKIIRYGSHMIMRNCWTAGSGYLMKREVIERVGLIKRNETFTTYCVRAAAKGYINGWYYPFLYQEHMDDPRARHSGIKTEADFQRMVPLTARNFNITSMGAWEKRLRESARRLQKYSYDPADFIGLKARIRKKLAKVFGKDYLPLVKTPR